MVTTIAVLGANVFRDVFADLTDIFGWRSTGYERSLRQARETAIEETASAPICSASATIIWVYVNHEFIQLGQGGSMLMVNTSGTAVKL